MAPIAQSEVQLETTMREKGQSTVTNRPDQWKIEQGFSGAVLPVLDMTGPETKTILPPVFGEVVKDDADITAGGDRDALFKREREGWKG